MKRFTWSAAAEADVRKLGLLVSASSLPLLVNPAWAQTAPATGPVSEIVVIGEALGRGEARANSVIDATTIREQPAGVDPLRLLNRVPGLQVSSSDALTGSFSMRLSMRGLNKEQIGISIDGIPNGSTLSNGGTLPTRLLETANLVRIDASQTAGDIGTPSNQALGGYIDFKTRDPSRERGADVELAAGSFNYQRAFVRFDTGEFAPGLRGFANYSNESVRTWPGSESGRSRREHADARIIKEFEGRSSLRATFSYNSFSDNDYDAVALRTVSAPFYKANFETNPNTDGLTDTWTGNPAIDQNNRRTRGIDSREIFTHLAGRIGFDDATAVTIKPYFHHQEGNGWFYVPYVQLPANGVLYSAVQPGASPVATVQECFANQYQRTAAGALIPVPAVTFPPGVSAATLAAAGCPAAGRFAMNPPSQWGAREASRRRGGYAQDRAGTLGEATTAISTAQLGTHELRVGGWYEHIDREKTRNWYRAAAPAISYGYNEADLYSITQDRHYRSNTTMAYVQDRIHLFDKRLEIDLGGTWQRFSETYRSPVEFYGLRSLTVSSGFLPKGGMLFRINDDLELFASGSKNFSAIPDSVFEGTAAVDAKKGIQPETSTNFDGGIRWTRGAIGLSAQAYSIDFQNRISIQNGNPNGDIFSRDATTTFNNQGGIVSRGFELTARATLDSVDLYATYAYNDAHYEADTPAEGIRKGDPVLGAARHNLFAEATWRPIDGLRFTANVKYLSKAAGTYNIVPNTVVAGGPVFYPREYIPSYALVGLSASYQLDGLFQGRIDRLELQVNVENLFDKRYLGGIGAELTTSNPLTSGRYFLGNPRTIFVALRGRF
jgi:iron complex outermembrane recepter protein